MFVSIAAPHFVINDRWITMQARLLQKVEELTLYIIELKKENEEIKKMVNSKKE